MSDIHSHYCRMCRRPWTHDGDQFETDTEIKAAHHCPDCGTSGWAKFYGTETHEEMGKMEALLDVAADDRLPMEVREQANDDFAELADRLHRPNTPGRRGPFLRGDAPLGPDALDWLFDL